MRVAAFMVSLLVAVPLAGCGRQPYPSWSADPAAVAAAALDVPTTDAELRVRSSDGGKLDVDVDRHGNAVSRLAIFESRLIDDRQYTRLGGSWVDEPRDIEGDWRVRRVFEMAMLDQLGQPERAERENRDGGLDVTAWWDRGVNGFAVHAVLHFDRDGGLRSAQLDVKEKRLPTGRAALEMTATVRLHARVPVVVLPPID